MEFYGQAKKKGFQFQSKWVSVILLTQKGQRTVKWVETNRNECDTNENECDADGNECDKDEKSVIQMKTGVILIKNIA